MYKTLFVFCFIVICGIAGIAEPSYCSAKTYKGTCGSNAHWCVDTNSHTMTVTGKGVINGSLGNYKMQSEQKKIKIKKIIIAEGITSLNCEVIWPGNYGSKGNERVLVKLPDSLKTIKNFGKDYYCHLSFDITIPRNVKSISPRAFKFENHCKSIVKVADNNPYFCTIDNIIFSKDKKTLVYYPANIKKKKYVVPESVRKIAPLAFMENGWLRRVILPDYLEELGSGAFFKCENLYDVYLSNKMKIKKITDYDTKGKWQADTEESYETNNSVYIELYVKKSSYDRDRYATEMRAGTFEGTSVRSITIPDSVKYISSNTFFNGYRTYNHMEYIKFGKNFSGNINLGESHDGMKTLTLNGAKKLKIRISKKNKKYRMENGILYNKDKTVLHLVTAECRKKTLYIPKSVRKIANGAFMENSAIQHVVVSGDLTSIGYNAFVQSKIKSFTCHGIIKTIKRNAFSDCEDLEKFDVDRIGNVSTEAFVGTPIIKDIEEIYLYNKKTAANVENLGQSPLSPLTISKSLQPMNFALYTRSCVFGE